MPTLAGSRILVVEDEYFAAIEVAHALQGAGAVVQMRATEKDAQAWLARERPDAATLDLNLQGALSFALADTMRDAGIPFLFCTGYSQTAIPARFAAVMRLEKPIDPKELVHEVARLLQLSTP